MSQKPPDQHHRRWWHGLDDFADPNGFLQEVYQTLFLPMMNAVKLQLASLNLRTTFAQFDFEDYVYERRYEMPYDIVSALREEGHTESLESAH